MEPKVRARVGLLTTGHQYYWDQYPGLRGMGLNMCAQLRGMLGQYADLVTTELIDTQEKAAAAGRAFRDADVDLIVIFPVGYTPSMNMLPAVRDLDVPLCILNAHEDRSYDYATADTALYLHHEGICAVPEFAGALVATNRRFRVLTGHFDDPVLQARLRADFAGAAAARFVRSMNVGLIGQVYTHMADMPFDEHRWLRATGRMLVRPEVEEIQNAFGEVTEKQLSAMYHEIRGMYDVDSTVTDEHLRFSAQAAIAYEQVIRRHNISAFGYYWWGEQDAVTQLRAQSGLAVSRLASLGCPGVTEGDVKSAIAMKILDLFGGYGMFVEFFAMNLEDGSLLMGHDGPSNIRVAAGRSRVTHLATHHGKSGHGLGIDFEVRPGPVTMLNLTQFTKGDTFKVIYSVADVESGPTLSIGNPNCRVRVRRPLPEFMDAWCQQGPSHHVALGLGDHGPALESFAGAMGFQLERV